MIRHSPEMAQEIYGDANISFTQVNTLVIPESWTISRVVVPSKLILFLHSGTIWSKALYNCQLIKAPH